MGSVQSAEVLAVHIYEAVSGAYGSTVSFENAHPRTKQYYVEAACRLADSLDLCLIEKSADRNARKRVDIKEPFGSAG